jgi:hypothetical protein
MPATTTLATIRDAMITEIEALSPSSHADKLFRRGKKRKSIREWAANQNSGSAVFRRFEIVRTGEATDPPLMDPSAVERSEDVIITVAYPVLPALYGSDDLDDLEEIARADAKQIRDVVFASDNYVSGQLAAFVTIQPLDRGDEDVWFQDLVVNVRYYEAQSLS